MHEEVNVDVSEAVKVERAWGLALALYVLERMAKKKPILSKTVADLTKVAYVIFGPDVMLSAVDRVATEQRLGDWLKESL